MTENLRGWADTLESRDWQLRFKTGLPHAAAQLEAFYAFPFCSIADQETANEFVFCRRDGPARSDPGLTEAFNADTRAHKVNTGVGVYFTDEGKIPLLRAVQEAEKARTANATPRGYLPIEGIAAYDRAVQTLLFGQNSPLITEGRVVTARRSAAPAR